MREGNRAEIEEKIVSGREAFLPCSHFPLRLRGRCLLLIERRPDADKDAAAIETDRARTLLDHARTADAAIDEAPPGFSIGSGVRAAFAARGHAPTAPCRPASTYIHMSTL